MTFSNEEDVIFFRHHTYEKRSGKEVVLHEVGPRFEMQLYQLRLGTLEQVLFRPVRGLSSNNKKQQSVHGEVVAWHEAPIVNNAV